MQKRPMILATRIVAPPVMFHAGPDDNNGPVEGEQPINWDEQLPGPDKDPENQPGEGEGDGAGAPKGETSTKDTIEEGQPPKEDGKESAKADKKKKPSEKAPKEPKEDAKAKEEATLKEKDADEPPAKEEAPKKEAPKPKEEPKVPETEEELDEIKPKSDNPRIKNDFDRLREAAKQAIRSKKEIEEQFEPLRKELEELKSKKVEAPEELTKEVERLRKVEQMMLLETDPGIQKEFSEKLSKADAAVMNILKGNLGLSEDKAKVMMDNGLDKYSGDWWKAQVLDKIKDPILHQKMVNALIARDGVKQENAAKLAELATDREGFLKKRQEEEAGFWGNYSKQIEDHVNTLAKDHPWAKKLEVPADATPEQKKQIEAHNKEFESNAQAFIETVNKIATHDTQAVATTVLNAIKATRLEKELATIKSELADRESRIEELESDISAATESGRVSKRTAAPQKTAEQRKAASASEMLQRQFEGKEVSVDEAFEREGI